MSRFDEDPFGHEPDYTVRCAECGSLIGTDKTLTGPRVCVPCAAGQPVPDTVICLRCGDQRSRFDPHWKGGFCGNCDEIVMAERESVVRKEKQSGDWDRMVKRMSEVNWTNYEGTEEV